MVILELNALHNLNMDADKKFITQISKKDLQEIAKAANAYSGDGINVTPTDAGLEIAIDKEQFSRWVHVIINGGKLM